MPTNKGPFKVVIGLGAAVAVIAAGPTISAAIGTSTPEVAAAPVAPSPSWEADQQRDVSNAAASHQAVLDQAAKEAAAKKAALAKKAEAKRKAEEAAKAAEARRLAQEKAARAKKRAAVAAAKGGTPAQNRALGMRMCADAGFSQSQCADLGRLWERESSWDDKSANGSSGAYGIPQSLPGSKMASAGSDWRTNPRTQIAWGLSYIKDVYGNPSAAWGHSQSYGWY